MAKAVGAEEAGGCPYGPCGHAAVFGRQGSVWSLGAFGKSAPTKGFFEGTKPMCSMVQVGLNYRFELQSTEDAAQNGDDLRRDPLEVRKTTRARRSYFRDVATGAFIFR